MKASLGTEGCAEDVASGMPPLPRQKREEGRGYAPIDRVTTAQHLHHELTAGLSAASKEPD